MADNEYNDLTTQLQSMSKELSDALESIARLQVHVQEQQTALGIAKKETEDARQKLRKALDFKEGEYVELISELFTEPKNELVRSFRSWAKKGAVATLCCTAAALGVSLYVSTDTRKELAALSREVAETTRSIDVSLGMLGLSMEGITEITQVLANVRDKHSSFVSRNDVALAYLMELVTKVGPEHYVVYLGAFRSFGIDDDAVPSQTNLHTWDQEAVDLYARWLQALRGRSGIIPKGSSDRQFGTFAAEGGTVQYGSWEFTTQGLTYDGLRRTLETRRAKHIDQMELNVQVTN